MESYMKMIYLNIQLIVVNLIVRKTLKANKITYSKVNKSLITYNLVLLLLFTPLTNICMCNSHPSHERLFS
jgi:hypothetical protein